MGRGVQLRRDRQPDGENRDAGAGAYPALDPGVIAADAGDCTYPSDVRVDAQRDLLCVKAQGSAGGMSEQMWLFEYDLRRQQLLGRLEVNDSVMPGECPDR